MKPIYPEPEAGVEIRSFPGLQVFYIVVFYFWQRVVIFSGNLLP
jgi:hypothetical protein